MLEVQGRSCNGNFARRLACHLARKPRPKRQQKSSNAGRKLQLRHDCSYMGQAVLACNGVQCNTLICSSVSAVVPICFALGFWCQPFSSVPAIIKNMAFGPTDVNATASFVQVKEDLPPKVGRLAPNFAGSCFPTSKQCSSNFAVSVDYQWRDC